MEKQSDMSAIDQFERLIYAIDSYYDCNPDTLMPLLMLALATNDELKITKKQTPNACIACSLDLHQIEDCEWVLLDPKLDERVQTLIDEGVSHLSVEMDLGRSLTPIHKIFLRNDTKDIVQEHHHRMGRLVLHKKNAASDMALRQYVTFKLAEAMIDCATDLLRSNYIYIFNYILEKSNIQPQRPRIVVAQALAALLKYDGKGLVYNPFAGCSIAGAMLRSAHNYYGDADTNDKLYAAGLLLNYGMGVSNEHFMQRDSTLWLEGKKIDYVLSTYMGYIDGATAFDFCLGKCLADPSFTGKYAGMVPPREIFDYLSDNFAEALRRDWIDAIVLLPFGEAAVLVDANKQANKGQIRLFNFNDFTVRNDEIEDLLSSGRCSYVVSVEEALRQNLKYYFSSEIPDREGYEKVRLGDLVSPLAYKCYDLSEFDEDQRVLAYIDRNATWYGNRWDENIERRSIQNLLGPAYLLYGDCLVVNSAGPAEPRLFSGDNGSAFFVDGFAFSIDDDCDPEWLACELRKPYVAMQLHPYGDNRMVPEAIDEDAYLDIILFKEIEGYEEEKEKAALREDAIQNALPGGFVISDGNIEYTIIDFISNGSFGYTYRAEMRNLANGEKEIVALKEYFPRQYLQGGCKHIYGKVVCADDLMSKFKEGMQLFKYEPDFITTLNQVPDHHVTELRSFFESKELGTMFYSMKYYSGLSLDDVIKSGIVLAEDRIIEKIVIPLCKALNVIHSHLILHLDIKPENVVLDENGEAVLIDFGVARQYDEKGNVISDHILGSSSAYSAPEYQGLMRHFSAPADIYGLAATLNSLLCYGFNAGGNDRYSSQMRMAILEGMQEYANDRPANAQQFLNKFPGCAEIKF